MNPRLPRVTADEVIRALERSGFTLVRQSGSHKIFRDSKGRRATVPYHGGRILHPKVLRSILESAELSVEEFTQLRRG